MSCRPLLISTSFDNSVVGKKFQASREHGATINRFAEECSIFSFKLAVLSYLLALNVVKSILFGKR